MPREIRNVGASVRARLQNLSREKRQSFELILVQVFLVRLLVLCLMPPLFLMAAFVRFVDGLVRRDSRRFGAGRESGFVYHRAKAALMLLVVLPWAVYLAMPISVSPILILLPSAVLLGVVVDTAAATFNKYL
ncbi:MAG: TIGR03747 family integrating conjugative element membrane protein [Gammaproteobacteria bacterium]